ncbi:MAG TPA: hypothetical protein P5121_35825, partial [Caldilineaceae bacterium]|nr:hypothetical protein [Caldilineaceae bacterium]
PTATTTPLPPTATATPLPPTATATPLPPTATDTPLPPTATATPLPSTATDTPPPIPTVATNEVLYFSFSNSGRLSLGSARDIRDEDIVRFDGTDYTLFFDGSDVSVGGLDLDAFALVDSSTALLSFAQPATINGLSVDDSDIVQFTATSWGPTTAGSFSLYFDGSDVGLTTNGEDVDAIHLLPNGELLLSTLGTANVPGLGTRALDEDLLRFIPQSLGNSTSGSWDLYFDGSAVALATASTEDVDGVTVDSTGAILLTTLGAFAVPGRSGAGSDVFTCTPQGLGANTACLYAANLFFDSEVQKTTSVLLDAIHWAQEMVGAGAQPPTATPTVTATPTTTSGASVPSTGLYLSLSNGGQKSMGTVSGIRDEDIVYFDGTNYTLFFDGSDVGVGGLDLDALAIVDSTTILLSFTSAATIDGVAADDSDIVQFTATSWGENTAGSFALYFDGSDVGLTTNGEDIDAIHRLSDGTLLISTVGTARVNGLGGRYLDEDLLHFMPQTLGANTSGTWTLEFDGSAVGLATTSTEDVDGVSVDSNDTLYLTTLGDFAVPNRSGQGSDVFHCTPTGMGVATACNFDVTLYFDSHQQATTALLLDAIAFP